MKGKESDELRIAEQVHFPFVSAFLLTCNAHLPSSFDKIQPNILPSFLGTMCVCQDHQALISENHLLSEDNQQLRQDNYALEEQIDELRCFALVRVT